MILQKCSVEVDCGCYYCFFLQCFNYYFDDYVVVVIIVVVVTSTVDDHGDIGKDVFVGVI
mgnify:CR=1 FL=1